jgi:protein-disulfide isomerase
MQFLPKKWANALDAEAKILGYAAALGIDTNKMKTDMADASVKSRVERDMKEAASIGLQGTPSFIINGTRITNLADIASVENFSKYLDTELAK